VHVAASELANEQERQFFGQAAGVPITLAYPEIGTMQ